MERIQIKTIRFIIFSWILFKYIYLFTMMMLERLPPLTGMVWFFKNFHQSQHNTMLLKQCATISSTKFDFSGLLCDLSIVIFMRQTSKKKKTKTKEKQNKAWINAGCMHKRCRTIIPFFLLFLFCWFFTFSISSMHSWILFIYFATIRSAWKIMDHPIRWQKITNNSKD